MKKIYCLLSLLLTTSVFAQSSMVTCEIGKFFGVTGKEVLWDHTTSIDGYFLAELLKRDTGLKKDYLFKAEVEEMNFSFSFAAMDGSFLSTASKIPLPPKGQLEFEFYTREVPFYLKCERN